MYSKLNCPCVRVQVVVEGVADSRSTGHIAVDNIQIIDGLSPEDCKGVCCVALCCVVMVYYYY